MCSVVLGTRRLSVEDLLLIFWEHSVWWIYPPLYIFFPSHIYMSKVLRDLCILVRSSPCDLVEIALDLLLIAQVQILVLFHS